MIGNPPYGAKLSETDKRMFRQTYVTTKTIRGIQKGSIDSYTLFIEQAYNLLQSKGCLTMIVPISFTSSDALSGVHRLLMQNCDTIRVSSYAVRPQPVFKNAVVNTSIIETHKTVTPCKHLYSTRMYRKGSELDLQALVDNLEFIDVKDYMLFGRIPKVSLKMETNILEKIATLPKLKDYVCQEGAPIYYRTSGGRYFKVVTNYSTGSTKEKAIVLKSKYTNAIGCVLSSNLSFWFYQIYSNNLDWKGCEIENVPLPPFTDDTIAQLNSLYEEYLTDIEHNAKSRKTSEGSSYNVSSFKEYKIGKSKPIIDRIDDLICPLYGLTKEETEFIKNYEIQFRLSDEE